MKNNVEMWKIKILLGLYPAKIEEYAIIGIRADIIKLFDTIFTVVYSGISSEEVKNKFMDSPYIINNICDILFKRKEKKKKKKTRIVYSKNTMLRWDIEEIENEIIIKVPNQEF